MMANVIITIGDNGKDIPKEVIEAVNAIMRSGITNAHATMEVDGVSYTIVFEAIREEGEE